MNCPLEQMKRIRSRYVNGWTLDEEDHDRLVDLMDQQIRRMTELSNLQEGTE